MSLSSMCEAELSMPIVLGANVFGWTADRDATFSVLDGFVAAGGAAIDTADGYSHWVPGHTGGESEALIGEWLRASGGRDRVRIATKVSTHPQFFGLAAANVRAAAEASLRRLGTDVIDVYYAHFDDANTPLVETASAFSELVDAGLIREIGVSNYSADRIREWIDIAREQGLHAPTVVQPLYNLVERGFEVNGVQAVAVAEGLSVFTYYSLASGFLTGKYRSLADVVQVGASVRASGARGYLDAGGGAVVAVLAEVAAQQGVSVAAVALAWVRQQPGVTAPIASARSVAQLSTILESAVVNLGAEQLHALDSVSASFRVLK